MPRRLAGLLPLLAALAGAAAWAGPAPAREGGSRPVGPAEMESLRAYGRALGEAWMRESLGLGLEDLELEWDPLSESFRSRRELRSRAQALAGRGEAGPGAAFGPGRRLGLRLAPSGGFGRLARGLKALPFGLELKNFLPLPGASELETRLKVPLSEMDEWQAGASLPLQVFRPGDASLWRSLGLGQRLALRSQLRSRGPWHALETGFETDWNAGLLGPWNLDYAWRLRYGMGERESVQWLRLSKEF